MAAIGDVPNVELRWLKCPGVEALILQYRQRGYDCTWSAWKTVPTALDDSEGSRLVADDASDYLDYCVAKGDSS